MQLLEKALGFNNTTSSLRTEIVAGATTFLTMSYILAVNPAILATTGMDKGAVFTATALASAIATLLGDVGVHVHGCATHTTKLGIAIPI